MSKAKTVERNIVKVNNRYYVKCSIAGKLVNFGSYETLEEARKVRDEAEKSRPSRSELMKEKNAERLKNLKEELIGKKYGMLTILDVYTEYVGKQLFYRLSCKCDCGNMTNPFMQAVVGKSAENVSCGCYQGKSGTKVLDTYLYKGTRVSNLQRKSKSRSGVKGVSKTKAGTYTAKITFQGKERYLGTYKTLEAAKEARREAEKKYFYPIIEEFNEQAKYKIEIKNSDSGKKKKKAKRKKKEIKIGDQYNERTVIDKGSKAGYSLCRCSCGTVKEVNDINLKYNKSKSCGHLRGPKKSKQ
ncbi:hypothetical protein [uncultured Anaerococcus sp.]|uniref:hypothetical protein n=1 Tax=uncultured Anaerococcus sp. TaxID=293428 RepID=UPI00288C53BD|nr:hypothetical protein [uncultured Anaerococcus sp.]